MIDLKQKIHQELSEYLSMEENLSDSDKLLILKAIFEKAFILQKSLHLINHSDILLIGSISKMKYGELSLPIYIGQKRVDYDDLRTIAMIEAFLGYMNSHHLLDKQIEINYKKGK